MPVRSVVSFFADRTRADTNALAGKELNNIGESLQHDFVYDKICKVELLIPAGVIFPMKREEQDSADETYASFREIMSALGQQITAKLERECVLFLNESVCVAKGRGSDISLKEVVRKDDDVEEPVEDRKREGGGRKKGKGGKGGGGSGGKEKRVRIEDF